MNAENLDFSRKKQYFQLISRHYIESFYNTVRIHSHDNYMSPNECERMYAEVISKNVKIAS